MWENVRPPKVLPTAEGLAPLCQLAPAVNGWGLLPRLWLSKKCTSLSKKSRSPLLTTDLNIKRGAAQM